LQPFGGRFVTSSIGFCGGSLERPLGLLASALGRFDAAGRHFDAAIEGNARLRARPWVAHSEHEYARMLLERGEPGDRERAVELLGRALETARSLGMASLTARVEALLEQEAVSSASSLREAVLRAEGEFWVLAFEGRSVRVRDARGLRLISVLLGSPGKEFRATELAGLPEPPEADAGRAVVEPLLPVSDRAVDTTGPDMEALAKYRVRLEQLRDEAEEAESFNDPLRAARAREEMEAILRELAAARKGAGRGASNVERARLSVTKAIRYAIRKVERLHPDLGHILTETVKTGIYCRYEPDPRRPIRWCL
jgi:tetratricopeptide (TPR) repeat protein